MSPRSRLLPFALGALVTSALHAQRLAETYSPAQLPPNLLALIARGDFDGDGFLDTLSLTTRSTTWQLSTSDGNGLFSGWRPVAAPAGVGAAGFQLLSTSTSLENETVADFDNDGDLDVAYIEIDTTAPVQQRRPRFAYNDGTGNFPTSGALPSTQDWDFLFAGDLDSDGDADLVTVARQQFLRPSDARVWLNDGTGTFVAGQLLVNDTAFTQNLGLLDQDADGDLDLFFGRLWDNTGNGTFVDRTLARFPLGLPGGPFRAAEITGDGLVDVVTPIGIFADNGSGGLIFSYAFGGNSAVNLEVFDYDGDGDADVVTTSLGDNPMRLFRNDGFGALTPLGSSAFPDSARDILRCDAIDIDGDSDLDLLVTANTNRSELYISDGQGRYIDASPDALPRQPVNFDRAKAADMDNDGDLDLIAQSNGELLVYLNDGFSNFTRVLTPPPFAIGQAGMGFELADFNGDGLLDAVSGYTVFRGDGTGTLTLASFRQINGSLITVTDYDNDGDLDVVHPRGALRNDGNFVFADALIGIDPLGGTETGILAVDVDRDGDSDLVIGTFSGPELLYFNDGTGVFSNAPATNMPNVDARTNSLRAADLDGDMDDDLLIVLSRPGSSAEVAAYENDGTGRFTVATQSLLGTIPSGGDATAADFDLDGDLDVLVTSDFFGVPAFLEQTPSGFLGATTSWLGVGRPGSTVGTADIDGDGDPDVLTDIGPRGLKILHNLRRHFEARNLARTGAAIHFRAHAETPVAETVVPFLSPLRFTPAVPTPWGPLLVDAGNAVALPARMVSLGAPTEWTVTAPNDPALIGFELFGQALFVPAADPWRLSNAVRLAVIE